MKTSVLFIVLCVSLSGAVVAQPERGEVGFSVLIQNPQLDFEIPIWAGSRFVIAPAFGVTSASDRATDWRAGVALRGYFQSDKLSPYAGVRFAALIYTPSSGTSVTDLLLGPQAGAEYFFDRHLSVGGELQLNFAFSDNRSTRFGNPGGTNINTATALIATFYF